MNANSNQDEEHLNLLAIFHYVVAGLLAFFSLMPVIHLAMGVFMVVASHKSFPPGQNPPPEFIGWLFIALAMLFITLGMTLAALILTTGRFLARRRHYKFCFVMAAVECLFMPFGTVLGVFTILVLNRASVKPLFAAPSVAPAAPAPPVPPAQ